MTRRCRGDTFSYDGRRSTISTRRLKLRPATLSEPSGLRSSASGRLLPNRTVVVIAFALTPWSRRYVWMVAARRSERSGWDRQFPSRRCGRVGPDVLSRKARWVSEEAAG